LAANAGVATALATRELVIEGVWLSRCPDQRHLAAKHIQQLRQFLDPAVLEEMADPGRLFAADPVGSGCRSRITSF